jgi:hypothetical protein
VENDLHSGAYCGAHGWISQIALNELHSLKPDQVLALAGNEAIDAAHGLPMRQKFCRNRPAYESRRTRHQILRHHQLLAGPRPQPYLQNTVDDLRESPSLTIIELLREKGAVVSYNDPSFPSVGRGRHYGLNMTNTTLDNLGQYDAVLIVTDHTSYDFSAIVEQAQLVIDTRNATKGINSPNIVRC